ncbi:hypothetical protein HH310_07680 [Actinoplanes sp. TBRC 11911]|uniref:hypothetical protein n=1 Tax=Actinoplanes sp. TBRC 11911 TaxID=2729386 RepID=UPI00145E5A99|nr:hypothetical protein [Actinoplanes sp. TBRC 11911]NMO51068.1 hypothetical protein [Actinoplanes sp. TBRC 11911]
MHRVRRLASVAVVASLAVTALSACRSQPNVAAYLGNERVTETRVQSVWDEAQHAATTTPVTDQSTQQAVPLTMTRADVVRVLVAVPVLDRVAQQESISLPPQYNDEAAAQITGAPQTTEYARLFAHMQTVVGLILQKEPNAAPSQADLRTVYDELVAAGQAAGVDFNTFSADADTKQAVGMAAAAQTTIETTTKAIDVRVNPRYGQLGVSVLDVPQTPPQSKPLITAVFDPSTSSPTVVDQS